MDNEPHEVVAEPEAEDARMEYHSRYLDEEKLLQMIDEPKERKKQLKRHTRRDHGSDEEHSTASDEDEEITEEKENDSELEVGEEEELDEGIEKVSIIFEMFYAVLRFPKMKK